MVSPDGRDERLLLHITRVPSFKEKHPANLIPSSKAKYQPPSALLLDLFIFPLGALGLFTVILRGWERFQPGELGCKQ